MADRLRVRVAERLRDHRPEVGDVGESVFALASRLRECKCAYPEEIDRVAADIAESIAYADPPREGFDPIFDDTGVQTNDPDDVAEAVRADRIALCR